MHPASVFVWPYGDVPPAPSPGLFAANVLNRAAGYAAFNGEPLAAMLLAILADQMRRQEPQE